MRLSDDLLSRITDKDLLHTCGFIGGKWLQASDRSTYQVRPPMHAPSFPVHNLTSVEPVRVAASPAAPPPPHTQHDLH